MTLSVSYANAAKVERPRGAALWALLILGGGWVGVRIIIGGMDVPLAIAEDAFTPARSPRLAANASKPIDTIAALPADLFVHSTKPMVQDFVAFDPYETVKSVPWSGDSTINALDQPMGVATPPYVNSTAIDDIERAYAGQIGPLFLFGSADQRDDVPPNWAVASPNSPITVQKPFSLYAYLFYRPHGGNAAPFAFYGGSQIYARADWRPFAGSLGKRSSLYARASRDLTSDGRIETALGISVTPLARIPLTVHTERRFRPHQPDATVAFVSTGGAAQDLPANTRVDWDGQAGYLVSDKGESTPFFDAQARLTTPVATHSDWSLRGGAMAATGGQKGAARLDIGPVLTVQNGAMQGQIGWRFRVAGDAEPKSGPAITLSIGF